MPRYKLTLEYNGTGFSGWQRVSSGPSIQHALEQAAAALCGEAVEVMGAGRTDAGVHAAGQVAHVDLPKDYDPFAVMNALNFHLLAATGDTPESRRISVVAAEHAAPEFHARFSATARHYCYRITNRRAPSPLSGAFSWHVPEALDVRAMQQAAALLIGTHDFTSFRDTQCQAKSATKTLDVLSVERVGEEVRVFVSARSFLHHQVRIITGSLKQVGAGQWSVARMGEALAARDRRAGGLTAPAHGLCLLRVDYNDER